jgi:hypothetical protein
MNVLRCEKQYRGRKGLGWHIKMLVALAPRVHRL